MQIERAELTHPAIVALIEHHLREAHANSPPGSAFAFDMSGLRDAAVTVWAAWDNETLLGIAALKTLGECGEVKSMRTAPGQERCGVARALLDHLIAEARARGYRDIKLETGTNEAYAPARRLYESAGFVPTGAFSDYALTDFNRCYALTL